MTWLVTSLAWGLAVGLASNLFRSWLHGARYTQRVREAIAERRRALPEEAVAITDAAPGEMIALRGELLVDEGCEPFVPFAKLAALSSPDPGEVVLSAREIDGRQEVVAGRNARLLTNGVELSFLPSNDPAERTRLVLGTYQILGRDAASSWSPKQAVYLSLQAGDDVWVVGRLHREVDEQAGRESYRREPEMRYALQEPLAFYATGEVDVRFRRLAVSAIDVVFAVAGTLIADVWLAIL
jgi:hypothetical protein